MSPSAAALSAAVQKIDACFRLKGLLLYLKYPSQRKKSANLQIFFLIQELLCTLRIYTIECENISTKLNHKNWKEDLQ